MLVKPGLMEGFGVLIAFMAVLAFASYGIGERLAGPKLGAIAALVVAASPGTFLFSREYIFALPTAAMLCLAVFALLRSNGLRSTGWSIACGAALGLMLLSRTMAIAFVPGVLVAAALALVMRTRGDLTRRLLNLAALVATGVAVAATWYLHNFDPVWEYLTSYGYGSQSAYYGAEHALVSWGRFSAVAQKMVFDDLLVPLAALVFVGLLALLIDVARRLFQGPDRPAVLRWAAASDAFSVAIVIAAGYAALMSSRNGGNGFTFPVSMLLPPLAILAVRRFRVALAPVAVALALITALNVAATSNWWHSLSKPRLVWVPTLGELPWVSGIPHAISAIRVQVPGPEDRFVPSEKGFPKVDEKLAQLLIEQGEHGAIPLTAFASRNREVSTNSVGLAGLLRFGTAIPFTQLNAEPEDSVDVYEEQLGSQEFGLPGIVITMSREADDFPPIITQRYVEVALRRLHFDRIDTLVLPDGRKVRVWRRPAAGTPQPAPAPRS
jgi:4-amino-4-deoxy-L-arabinose transferase-like glycosyltransferase